MFARKVALVLVVTAIALSAFSIGSAGARPIGGPVTGAVHAAAAPTASTTPTSHTPSLSAREALAQKVLTTTKNDHLPIEAASLPALLAQPHVTNGVITPGSSSPAPMGLGAYGVMNTTGTATPYSYTTSSWEGSITLNSVNTLLVSNDGALSTDGSQNTFGVQLNAVMTNVTLQDSSTYSFWTQNVLYFNYPSPGEVTFLDNIWNFSSPAFYLAPGTFYSYDGNPIYPEYYYDFGPSFSITMPITVNLYLNSSVTDLSGIGYPTVTFGFNIVNAGTGISEGSGVYDTVLFNSTMAAGSTPVAPYLVDGSQFTPTGYIPWDAEIMLGGPGGGTTTSVYGISGSESLQYLSGGSYVTPASAWDVGSETGETSEGIAEAYTSPGTVDLSAGPSFTMPLWGSTPGGNAGIATFAGPISPSNAFVFFNQGTSFDANSAGWAPTQTASHVSYALPPGTYTVSAMLSDYTPIQTTVTVGSGGSAHLNLNLHHNFAEGVYTPLDAWNNAQFAAISTGGWGTPWAPYQIVNNPAPGGLNPVFAQSNDYLYPVFPGVLFAGTTAYADLNHPSLFGVTYPTVYDHFLAAYGLPFTNNLGFELFDASDVSIWGAQGITGWFFFDDYGPTGGLPLANVVVFGGSHNLIGDNTFDSQGSSLLLATALGGPTGNVVWGNTFVNSTVLSPGMYPGNGAFNGPPIAIFAFEAGDLIYNNYVATSITAYSPDSNIFFGFPQLNLESWNLPMVEPSHFGQLFNGYWLSGTIVPSQWQGGNYWADYFPGVTTLPYDEYGYIQSGGDSFPYPIVAYSVIFILGHGFGTVWSVSMNGVTETTFLPVLVFYETPGSYSYTATLVYGYGSITPSSGTVTVVDHTVVVSLHHT
jgi:thermopsin